MLTKLVESLGGDIDHLNSIVNNKIEAAGKQIKDDITGVKSESEASLSNNKIEDP